MLFDDVQIIYGFPDGQTVVAFKADGKYVPYTQK